MTLNPESGPNARISWKYSRDTAELPLSPGAGTPLTDPRTGQRLRREKETMKAP
jgi:hypothetical protein